MSDVDIIIVNYNTRKHIETCIHSLHDPVPDVDHEIVVVDNGSTDGSADAVRARWPAVQVIDAGRNVGYSSANNLGIRQTQGEFILLLNSDTIVPAGTVNALVRRLQGLPDVAAIGPGLLDTLGRPELSFGRMIGPLNELIQKGKGIALARGLPILGNLVRAARYREGYHDWVSGACLLVRRTDAERVGLLDERFFLYGEDVDFCAALRKIGRRIFFAPEIQIVHHRGQSGAIMPKQTRIAYRRSHLTFYEKHHPAWAPLLRLYLRLRRELPIDLT
jgi:GT2 family glycosyltransferase